MTIDMLQQEMYSAMKNKNKLRKDTIAALIGAINKTAIDRGCKDNISESLINEVILKEQKTINEMIDRIKLKDIELNKVTTELSSLKSKMAIEKRNHRRANRLIILLVAIIIIIIAI